MEVNEEERQTYWQMVKYKHEVTTATGLGVSPPSAKSNAMTLHSALRLERMDREPILRTRLVILAMVVRHYRNFAEEGLLWRPRK